MTLLIPLVVVLTLVAMTALYVAAEFAVVGSRRSRVQESAETGNTSAATLLAILSDAKKLDTYIAACQVGITLTSLIAGAYGQAQLTPYLTVMLGKAGGPVIATVLVLLVITALQVVLGELLPKTVVIRYPERLALATLRPMQLSLLLFSPLIALFNGTAMSLLRAFKLNVDFSHAHVHSPDELEDLYRESAAGGLIDEAEREMVAGALNVDDRVAREIMTHRTRLVTVDGDLSVAEALQRVVDSPYSRFPVSAHQGDDLVGMLHLRMLYLAAETTPQARVRDVMLPPVIVVESLRVPELWRRLREAGRHSALVVDEYGSVIGMVTLEDALEEIFGEVQDEFDAEEDPIKEHAGRVLVRGDVLIEQLNDRYGLRLPTEDVDTVSGLMWHTLGRLPVLNDEVTAQNVTFKVEGMERRAVQCVSFTIPEGLGT